MKTLTLLAIIITAASCTKNYRPESVGEKMGRYTARHSDSVSYPKIASFQTTFKGVGRAPASLQNNEFYAMTNKTIYFTALYKQYNEFNSYLNDPLPSIEICPSFHSSVLDLKNKFPKMSTKSFYQDSSRLNKVTNMSKEKAIALYPEFGLTVDGKDVFELAKEVSFDKDKTQGFLSKAIITHNAKNFSELGELCQTGQSTNYFIYENMSRYMNSHPGLRKSKTAMDTLLKSSVVSNMAILKSLSFSNPQTRAPASDFDKYDEIVLVRLNAYWSKEYFAVMKKLQ